MPTDATGTPTFLGIPTYDTSADAPSGIGFNGTMAVIDGLLGSGFTTAAPADGDVPVWDNTAGRWKRSTDKTPNIISGITGAPVGAIHPYVSPTAPTGWLLCDGSAVNRTTYSTLFAVISTRYGSGDGSTTFNLPDLQGRMPIGFAATGGHADVSTLGNNDGTSLAHRRAAHSHTVDDPGHSHTIPAATTGQASGGPGNWTTGSGAPNTGSTTTGITVGVTAGTAPNDEPSFLVVSFIVKY